MPTRSRAARRRCISATATRAIPLTDVETIRAKRPESEIHVYPAGHGFHCDERASYDAASAAIAWQPLARLPRESLCRIGRSAAAICLSAKLTSIRAWAVLRCSRGKIMLSVG